MSENILTTSSERVEQLRDMLGDFVFLRALNVSSTLYLSRESATQRLLVLKFFTVRSDAFQAEAQALADLDGFAFAPRLYFATSSRNASCIGMEYRTGKTALSLLSELPPAEKSRIRSLLKTKLLMLHRDRGRYHGDLSPSNILLDLAHADPAKHMTLLDWEFSGRCAQVNSDQYTRFQGTLGTTDLDVHRYSPPERDLRALDSIFGPPPINLLRRIIARK